MEKVEEITKEVKRADFLNEFLWICAGVNRKVLRQCPTDYAKYAGIGGTILFTALMAMLSGGYAIYTVFDSTTVAICFGIFWGLLIFNLDRFMVNTMYSDGTHKITKDEWKGGIPRLILAVFLGIVISTPIEMKIFGDKIEYQIRQDQIDADNNLNAYTDSLEKEKNKLIEIKHRYESKLTELRNGSANGYSSRITELENKLYDAENKLYEETNGTGITQKRGYGPAAQQLQRQVERLKKDLEELKKEERITKEQNQDFIEQEVKMTQNTILDYERQIKNMELYISNEKGKTQTAIDALESFSARLDALGKITAFSWDNQSLFWARIMIMFLFIVIEIIPTLFKMMMTSGPYDDLLRSEMHKIRVMSDKRISDINDEINTAIKISTAKNKEKLEAELLANKDVLNRIATAQAELLQTAIDTWREEELKKIKENPSAYIKTSTKHEK